MSSAGHVVKYKAGKATFEVLVKPGTVLKWRQGELGIENVVVSDTIFKSFSKAETAKREDLRKEFGDLSEADVIRRILEKGEIPLTSAERKEKIEKKRNELVNYVHKYFVDSRTKLPHPVTRIENAFEEIKVHIDPDVPADRQIHDILKKLVEVLPLKKCEMEATLSVDHKYVGQVSGVVHRIANVEREQYNAKGCTMTLQFVPGDYDALVTELVKITKGDFSLEVLGQGLMASTEDDNPQKGKPEKGKSEKGRGGRGRGRKR